VSGVHQKLNNGFSDPENPYNDGFKQIIIKSKGDKKY